MRLALISDIHTKNNLNLILEYIRRKNIDWKLDAIIVNGDILGENEAREGYGFEYNKALFHASLNREAVLKSIVPELTEKLSKLRIYAEQGLGDETAEIEYAGYIKEYVKARYDYLFDSLKRFSGIAKTYFNIGTYESPLHYNVLKELSFLLEVNESTIRKIAMLSNYRDTFKDFTAKFKDPAIKRLHYVGGSSVMEGDLLIAGIPGLNHSSVPSESASEFQERITEELMSSITRKLSYTNKIMLLNQTQGKLRKDPFAYRPASLSVRNFIEKTRGKMRQKIFVQSYHHWPTTHFYTATEFHFILNNSAVNNCLFNIIEIGNKIGCFDIDPGKDKARKLLLYNYNLEDYSKPEERLALNYESPSDIISERKLSGCYYM
jgi:hypothetical protein